MNPNQQKRVREIQEKERRLQKKKEKGEKGNTEEEFDELEEFEDFEEEEEEDEGQESEAEGEGAVKVPHEPLVDMPIFKLHGDLPQMERVSATKKFRKYYFPPPFSLLMASLLPFSLLFHKERVCAADLHGCRS